MKLMAGRQYKYDLSDIIGILWEHDRMGKPITLDRIKIAVNDLYDSYEKLPEHSRAFIERAITDKEYEARYKKVRQMEADNKDILLQFQDNYPGVTNTDNVNDILEAINKKKRNDQE